MRTGSRVLLVSAAVAAVAALAAPSASATLVWAKWGRPSYALWAAHDDGGSARRLPARGSEPHVSPDGRWVAYAGSSGLFVVPVAGGRPRRLARRASFLAWSPDSRTLAASVEGFDRAALVTIDVASARSRTLASAVHVEASFSPRGSALVYTCDGGLCTVPVRSGRPTPIVRDAHALFPLWGRLWIVYTRWRQAPDTRKWDLWAVKSSGAQRHQLTHQHPGRGLAGLRPVAWSANGHRLVADFVGEGTDYAETVSPFTGAIRRVGKPAGGERGAGIFAAGISRDGTTILGSTGAIDFDGDAYALPWRGGKPRLLAHHAIEPSWSR